MHEVLVSGCRDNQYSYDARIDGTYHGAMTYFALRTIEEANYKLTYEELWDASSAGSRPRGTTRSRRSRARSATSADGCSVEYPAVMLITGGRAAGHGPDPAPRRAAPDQPVHVWRSRAGRAVGVRRRPSCRGHARDLAAQRAARARRRTTHAGVSSTVCAVGAAVSGSHAAGDCSGDRSRSHAARRVPRRQGPALLAGLDRTALLLMVDETVLHLPWEMMFDADGRHSSRAVRTHGRRLVSPRRRDVIRRSRIRRCEFSPSRTRRTTWPQRARDGSDPGLRPATPTSR